MRYCIITASSRITRRLKDDPTTIEQERDSVYNNLRSKGSAKLPEMEIHSTLNGPNAEVNFDGLNLLLGSEHGDTTIVVEHQDPHCRSSQFYRSVLDDTARCVFQGKVHVHQIAQKTDGYQLSNALLLSDKAEMDTKPELEIYADDVKCSHGATTGQIEGEAIFYLRSRGLSEAQARLLLTQAFAQEVVDKIQHEDIRTEMEAKVEQWLRCSISLKEIVTLENSSNGLPLLWHLIGKDDPKGLTNDLMLSNFRRR